MNISLDTTVTGIAYNAIKSQMNHLNQLVHEDVLNGEFMAKHSKRLLVAIEGIASANQELAIEAFSGELFSRFKVVNHNYSLYDQAVMDKYRAFLIVNILIDNGTFRVREEGRTITKNGRKVVVPVKYVVTGGKPTRKHLQTGYNVLPGGIGRKKAGVVNLNPSQKAFLAEIGSQAFCVSDVYSPELVQKIYDLMDDYHSSDKATDGNRESGFRKRARYATYGDAIADLATWDEFYLPVYFDGRMRMYYEAQLIGLRPQGKLIETLLIDSAEARPISKEGAAHLRHIIYILWSGERVTSEFANANFGEEHYKWAISQDPMDLSYSHGGKALDEMGNRMLARKAAMALDHYDVGMPCKYIFGKDLTNSGLLMAASAFQSPEMMLGANLLDSSACHDSHTQFGDAYELPLTRSDIKKIHMGLLHGSTMNTIQKMISEALGEEIALDTVHEYNLKAYGACVDNIDAIASWGAQIVDNKQTLLKWKTPDGYLAQSMARFDHVTTECYAASASAPRNYVKGHITTSMPMAFDLQGFPIHASGENAGVYSKDGVVVKNRGLYANITHSLDGYLLRRIMRRLLDEGFVFLMKHDDYMVPADAFDIVIEEVLKFFKNVEKHNYYQRCVDQIAKHSGDRVQFVPKVILGNGKVSDDACNFLMP